MSKAMISAVIINYNYEHYLSEAIESVLQQTFSPSEILIFDDGSSDQSIQLIESYIQKYPDKIRLIQHQGGENKGIQKTYRAVIKEATGPWIAFLEADDYWRQDKLEKCNQVIQLHSQIGLIFSDFKPFGYRRGSFYWELYSIKNRENLPHGEPFDLFQGMLTRNAIASFSHVVLKKELLSDIPQMKCMQMNFDWWILGHAANRTASFFFPEKLSYWRIHSKSYGYRPMSFFLMMRLHVFLVKYLNALLEVIHGDTEKIRIIEMHLDFLAKIKNKESAYLFRKIARHPLAFMNFLMFVFLKKILF